MSARLAVALIILSLVQSCKKQCQDATDPDCSNYDPCLAFQPLTAGFEAWDKIVYDYPNMETRLDDTCSGADVVFRPVIRDGDSYQWHVGAQTYLTKDLTLNFGTAPDSSVIPVSLNVYRKRNARCPAMTDTMVSQTKNIVIRRARQASVIYGTWTGGYDDTAGLATVQLVYRNYPGSWGEGFAIYGLSNGIDSLAPKGGVYRFAAFFPLPTYTVDGSATGKVSPVGYAVVDSTRNNITITYQWPIDRSTGNWRFQTRIFRGKRR